MGILLLLIGISREGHKNFAKSPVKKRWSFAKFCGLLRIYELYIIKGSEYKK
jgi:hypothetical protein